jgi:hypothetical protein
MPDPVNLTGEIAAAIDGAALRGHTLALAYVRDDGSPSGSVDSISGAGENGFFKQVHD